MSKINIYKNNKAGDKQPTWKGFLTIDNQDYELALWPAKNGKPDAYSGQFKPKQEYTPSQQDQAKPNTYQPQPQDELDDEVPF